MRSASRLRLPLVLLVALLAPSCGSDTGTIPDVVRAGIIVTVDPNPVPPGQDSFTGAVSIGYRVTLTEVLGLGGVVQFVSGQVYDPETGLLANQTYFDSADLIVFVGTNKIAPGGTLEVPQTLSYRLPDLRANALLVINMQMKDDRENLVTASVLVRVEPAPAPAGAQAGRS